MTDSGLGFRAVLSRLRSVFRRQAMPVPVGTLMSPTDALAERLSLQATQELFASHRGCDALAKAFARFVGDPDGHLVILKSLHIAVEERMRAVALVADPPDRNGFGPVEDIVLGLPLDAVAARNLSLPAPPRRLHFYLRSLVEVAVQGGLFFLEAIAAALTAGKPPAVPRPMMVATPHFANAAYWQAILDSVRSRVGDDAPLLLMVNHPGQSGDAGPGTLAVDPGRLPVKRWDWLGTVMIPGLRMAASILLQVLMAPRNAAILEIARGAFFEARQTLPIRRLADHFRIGNYIDIDEYTATHIVRSCILRKTGARVVRWPHCVMDSPGAALSFLGYDLFLSGGMIEMRDHSKSWSPNVRHVPTGLVKNDFRLNQGERVGSEIEARITDHLANGGRVAAYFGMSPNAGLEVPARESLEALSRVLIGHSEWLLVVKAKGDRSLRVLERVFPMCPAFGQLRAAGQVLIVPYDHPGQELCAAGWLNAHMSLGVGFGSVMAEALVRNIPLFCYYPVLQDTPTQRSLVESGLLHDRIESFEAALRRWINAPEAMTLPVERCREMYDVFADDIALDRISALLWQEPTDIAGVGASMQ